MSNATSIHTRDSEAQVTFGADVIMTRQGRDITLHAPGADGRRVLGRFTSVADAWQALDDLDAPFYDEISEAV